MEWKSRTLKDHEHDVHGKEKVWLQFINPSKPWYEDPVTFSGGRSFGSQVTGSISHRRDSDGKYRQGGPFYSSKSGSDYGLTIHNGEVQFTHTHPFTKQKTAWAKHEYENVPIRFPKAALSSFLSMSPPSPIPVEELSDLEELGATAIARSSPVNPVAEAGTAVGELYKDGLPSLYGAPTWKERTSLLRGAGSEYLNHVFGWVPLVAGVKEFASTASKTARVLKQYERDSGLQVRREYTFDTEKHEDEVEIGEGYAEGPGWTYGSPGEIEPQPSAPGKILVTSGSQVRTWFVGAFTYAMPSQGDTWKRLLGWGSDADILYGASLSPDLLWNLAPWSWAVDWFSNTGDVINNISAYLTAGQVMSYGYIMSEEKNFLRLSMTDSGFPGIPAPSPIEYYSSTKRRQPANPFGFGLSWEGLSPTQLAITAALGITRLR